MRSVGTTWAPTTTGDGVETLQLERSSHRSRPLTDQAGPQAAQATPTGLP